ncbi:MAG: hypothetical protein ACYDHX_07790 [Methanothrix sp.]
MDLFDAFKRSQEIEMLVMRGEARLYDLDKFRFQKFYGGIITAGSRGCGLDCTPCWNHERNACPSKGGAFLRPSEVAAKLEKLAGKKTDKARISGCEPILGSASAQHLANIISGSRLDYVIETSAVAIGAFPEILSLFDGLDNYLFRVSLKATNALDWERFTGTDAFGFVYQQRGIQAIQERHLPYKIAFMPQFIDYRQIDERNAYRLEEENLKYYPGVKARMLERGLRVRART